MFKMLYDSNFTYDSSMPIYENRPPSWPYTLDYKIFHDCMIPPCPTRSYPGNIYIWCTEGFAQRYAFIPSTNKSLCNIKNGV